MKRIDHNRSPSSCDVYRRVGIAVIAASCFPLCGRPEVDTTNLRFHLHCRARYSSPKESLSLLKAPRVSQTRKSLFAKGRLGSTKSGIFTDRQGRNAGQCSRQGPSIYYPKRLPIHYRSILTRMAFIHAWQVVGYAPFMPNLRMWQIWHGPPSSSSIGLAGAMLCYSQRDRISKCDGQACFCCELSL